jgi:outer membrane protein OmpA-like peptidoglycan-associated protein
MDRKVLPMVAFFRLRPVTLLVLAIPLLSCVSGNKIRADLDVLKADTDRARRLGALRCAPQELATAEANIEFAEGDLSQGESFRAASHTHDAEVAVKQALAAARECAPKQVLVKQVVKVEDTDKDEDGIVDRLDKCPDQPEDKDDFEDEDGCPELDNDNDGIVDAKDRCPNLPGELAKMGCPDRDNDGIYEDVDKCPDDPEDIDGFQDEDGCPDNDNDNDGFADKDDACPNEPGIVEENGCPKKYKMVVVTKEKIQIKQQLKFRTASAKIANKASFAVLDDVAAAMRDNPRIKKIRIEGHTDSVGNDTTNLKLSQGRADAVLAELIKRGVDPSRFEAVGFGETQPIASNTTATGRAENRRTEFNIVEQD